jgi:ubiquinone/menaquinone biosynthesis C-methylase UbiE
MADSKAVKSYWESRSPGLKHSQSEVGSLDFFREVEFTRYDDPFKYKFLKEVAEFSEHKGKKVLEIGVGLGTDSLQFAKGGALVHGIDLTARAIELTKKRFELEGYSGNFQTASFVNIPFEDNSMDVVYSFGVLHHSEETQEGIDEVYRVLKPGGKCIIMLYHKGFKYYVRKLFYYGILKGDYLKYNSQEIINRRSEDFQNCPLTKAYTRGEANVLFSKYKDIEYSTYRMDDYIYINKKMFSPLKFILRNRLYRKIENRCGWNLIIKGKK